MRTITILFYTSFIFIVAGCQFLNRRPPGGEYFKETYEKAQMDLKSKNDERAESQFREVYQLGVEVSPNYSVAALFELSKLSEKKGEFVTALSQLKEVESKKEFLPTVQAALELPARLAGLYAALGEIMASESYTIAAEKALQIYASQIRPDQNPQWWAETHFRMAALPMESMQKDNWLSFSKRFDTGFPHLIRSMEYADPVWSQRSLSQAESYFKKTIELSTLPLQIEDENWMVTVDLARERLNFLQYLIRRAQLWKSESSKNSKWARGFYMYLADMERHVAHLRAQLPEAAPLSPESARRKELKRSDLDLKPVGSENQTPSP